MESAVPTTIVFTFIGQDKPGLVEKLSHTVAEHQGNWLESRMSQLAGHFAGIARIQVSSDHVSTLRTALEQLSQYSLVIQFHDDAEPSNLSSASSPLRNMELSLIGSDRPGIVRELSRALAAMNINVCEMNTSVTSAPMSAEPLFQASAAIQVPGALDLAELQEKLDSIANELSVDITLETP